MAILVLLYNMRLVTELDSSCLRVRFSPFVRKEIPLSDIVYWKARTYDPIREYGGWGVRMWRGSGALNMCGNSGVQLVLMGGERLLIGSQRAYALAAAILLAKSESQ